MAGRTKPMTLEQKIEQGIARRQFTFSSLDEAETRLTCNWCQESLLIDYYTFGMSEMTLRIKNFVTTHSTCEPQWKTKDKDMVLAPKEKVS